MADEKDRFGEKLRQKEKAEEDRFIEQRDKEALERLRKSRAAAAKGAPCGCPRDGTQLVQVDHHGVKVEECPTCHGMWLDADQLQAVASAERDSWIGRLFYRPRR